MSIINEALKKTQSEFSEKEGQDISNLYKKIHTPLESEINQQPANTKEAPPASSSQIPILLTIFVLLISIFLATKLTMTKTPLSTTKSINNSVTKVASLIHSVSPKLQSKPMIKPDHKKGDLVLNGTMMVDPNKTVALINNEIYQVGDSINGKQIVSITMDGVELTANGKTEFLTVEEK